MSVPSAEGKGIWCAHRVKRPDICIVCKESRRKRDLLADTAHHLTNVEDRTLGTAGRHDVRRIVVTIQHLHNIDTWNDYTVLK